LFVFIFTHCWALRHGAGNTFGNLGSWKVLEFILGKTVGTLQIVLFHHFHVPYFEAAGTSLELVDLLY